MSTIAAFVVMHVIDGAAHSPHRQTPGEFTQLLLEVMA